MAMVESMAQKRINKGSGLVEYVLPTAIVGLLVGMTLFSFGQKDLILNFLSSSANVKFDKSTGIGYIGKNNSNSNNSSTNTQNNSEFKAGYLGGSESLPVKQCNETTCNIDFGSFILSGVPANFSDMVNSQGSAGGTEVLASLLDQIIAQKEDKIPESDLDKIKDLSNMSHLMARYEKFLEQSAATCKVASDSTACINNLLNNNTPAFTPPEELINKFNKEFDFSEPGCTIDIGAAMNDYINNRNEFNAVVEEQLPYLMVKQYNEVMNNTPSLSNAEKSVIKELYWDVGTMGGKLDCIFYSLHTAGGTVFDPTTGVKTTIDTANASLDDITNPDYSTLTHVDSALICASSHSNDINYVCH